MPESKLVSIQVGQVKTHTLPNGDTWTTAYEKTPVAGAVAVKKLSLAGDEQYHKKVHGGEHRAVLMYTAEHYNSWHKRLERDLPYGAFSENLTITHFTETDVAIGDVFLIGDVKLEVSQPRSPCSQIGQFWNIPDLMQQTVKTGYTGWYLRVLEEGTIEAGMMVERIANPYPEWTIARVHEVRKMPRKHAEATAELAQLAPLNPEWREKFRKHQGYHDAS